MLFCLNMFSIKFTGPYSISEDKSVNENQKYGMKKES